MTEAQLTRGQWGAFWVLSGTILFQQIFDIIFTMHLLQFPGFYEGNPVVAPIISTGVAWFISVKMAVVALMACIIYLALKARSWTVWLFTIVIAGYFMLMGWQTCLIVHASSWSTPIA